MTIDEEGVVHLDGISYKEIFTKAHTFGFLWDRFATGRLWAVLEVFLSGEVRLCGSGRGDDDGQRVPTGTRASSHAQRHLVRHDYSPLVAWPSSYTESQCLPEWATRKVPFSSPTFRVLVSLQSEGNFG
jgi:hypothetical protein